MSEKQHVIVGEKPQRRSLYLGEIMKGRGQTSCLQPLDDEGGEARGTLTRNYTEENENNKAATVQKKGRLNCVC